MEYTIMLNSKASITVSNTDGSELYRKQMAQGLPEIENISGHLKEALKSRHNDMTVTEYASKPSPELLAIVKERGECGKGRYENPELELDLEWDYKVFKGSIGKYSYSDPFIREGGLDAYLVLGKYAAVFTDYEDTTEYDSENGIITKTFNSGHSATYLAGDFRITAVEGEVETAALRVPCIGPVFHAKMHRLSGMHAGGKTRFILPDETEIIFAGGKTSYLNGEDVLIPESLAGISRDEIMEKYPCKDWEDMKNHLEDAFESLENLKIPDIDKIREDLFKKIDRFKELAERYTIQGISDSFDTTVRNFEEMIKKIYEPEIPAPLM